MIDANNGRLSSQGARGFCGRRGICFSLFALILAAAFAAAPLFAQAPVQTTDHARQLRKQLMCTWACGDTAGTCSHPGAAFSGPCEPAQAQLQPVDELLARGEPGASSPQTSVK